MTRTTTAAPAPRNGRNGKVRTVKVSDPAILASADLSRPELPEDVAAELIDDALTLPTTTAYDLADSAAGLLSADVLAMLAEAEAEEASARRVKREPVARVRLTPQQGQAMAAAGWAAPQVTANLTAEPQPRDRFNACKGGAAYRVALVMLAAKPLHVADLAALWIGAGNRQRPLNGVLQQIANRAGRTVRQDGALIMLG